MFPPLLLWLAGLGLLSEAEGACPAVSYTRGKRVFCYYEGKRSPSELDPCPCTHLVYKNLPIDVSSRLRVTDRVLKDITELRELRPQLKVLLSIGGQAIPGDTLRAIVSRKDQLANFTDSLNALYQDNTIQGMELDWEWPLDTNDKKDKIKLIRYMRQLKLATGSTNVRRRLVRSAETTVDDSEDDLPTTTNDPEAADTSIPSGQSDTTTEWSNQRDSVEENEEASTLSSSADMEETTKSLRRRTMKRKRVKGVRKAPTDIEDISVTTEVIDYEDRISLEDILFDEEENLVEDSDSDEFFLALRLSPVPEYLVKGYEFKMLNKFVDMYTLSTHNFTRKQTNVTYHHSRLMGVSDIENTDALIDVAVGLGAPLEKIVLTTPAFGNSFNLLDSSLNLPGSSISGPPQRVTYQQVCHFLSKGNWTLERDEDLTGPYSYFGKKWLAFDDDTSLKIKAKYVLLRDMAGIGLMSIDADDLDNVCGKGKQSLLHTIDSVISSLQRKPRQLIVTSLEQDLLATAQNFVPVTSAQGLTVSPFRIVRIVDREGQIQSIRENSETVLECSRQGYYRHPEDCSRFYRCVKFNQYENDYTIFEYGCPDGLVFDDRWEVCVWPSQATPCDGSSEIFPIPKNDYVCPGEGFFVDPENCRWFYACRDHYGDGTFTHYEFRCPFGLAFDENNLRCDWPWLVSSCDNGGASGFAAAAPLRLPTRKEVVQNFRAQPSRSPFPSVPSIPSFESSRTAIPRGGRHQFATTKPILTSNRPTITARKNVPFRAQSILATRPTPISTFIKNNRNRNKILQPTISPITNSPFTPSRFTTKLPRVFKEQNIPTRFTTKLPTVIKEQFIPTRFTTKLPRVGKKQREGSNKINDFVVGTVAKDSCENCFSPVLTISGKGRLNSKGIEVANEKERQGRQQFNNNAPYKAPQTTTSSTLQEYQQNDRGYEYPVPNNPLSYETTQKPLTSPTPVSPQTGNANSSPFLAKPLPVGISVSNPGENGLLPGYNEEPKVVVTQQPTVVTYGTSSPSYVSSPNIIKGGGITQTYAPVVSTTYKPAIISSTYSPASPSYQSAFEISSPNRPPANNYFVNTKPSPIVSVVTSTYSSSNPSRGLSNYGSGNQPSKDYGVPIAPVVSTTYSPNRPSAVKLDYNNPSNEQYINPLAQYTPVAFTTAKPLPQYAKTVRTPIVTVKNNYNSPSNSFNIPRVQIASEEPSEAYGVPQAPVISSFNSFNDGPIEQPSYEALPLENYESSRPASLPSEWPMYPSGPANVNQPKLSPPVIKYGGFRPASIPDPIRFSPVYQQPQYRLSQPNIDYGGFKALPPAPIPPYSPNIPAYGSPGYEYPVPQNPLTYPTTPKYKPVKVTPAVPVYSTTIAPINPSTPSLPAYGLSPKYALPVSSTMPPRIKVVTEGYSYPVPNNPLELPKRKGKSNVNNKPVVASVNPAGFSSATLSNGPFSSISSIGGDDLFNTRQQKSFGESEIDNEIDTEPFTNKKSVNIKQLSKTKLGQQLKTTLKPFLNFGGTRNEDNRPLSTKSSNNKKLQQLSLNNNKKKVTSFAGTFRPTVSVTRGSLAKNNNVIKPIGGSKIKQSLSFKSKSRPVNENDKLFGAFSNFGTLSLERDNSPFRNNQGSPGSNIPKPTTRAPKAFIQTGNSRNKNKNQQANFGTVNASPFAFNENEGRISKLPDPAKGMTSSDNKNVAGEGSHGIFGGSGGLERGAFLQGSQEKLKKIQPNVDSQKFSFNTAGDSNSADSLANERPRSGQTLFGTTPPGVNIGFGLSGSSIGQNGISGQRQESLGNAFGNNKFNGRDQPISPGIITTTLRPSNKESFGGRGGLEQGRAFGAFGVPSLSNGQANSGAFINPFNLNSGQNGGAGSSTLVRTTSQSAVGRESKNFGRSQPNVSKDRGSQGRASVTIRPTGFDIGVNRLNQNQFSGTKPFTNIGNAGNNKILPANGGPGTRFGGNGVATNLKNQIKQVNFNNGSPKLNQQGRLPTNSFRQNAGLAFSNRNQKQLKLNQPSTLSGLNENAGNFGKGLLGSNSFPERSQAINQDFRKPKNLGGFSGSKKTSVKRPLHSKTALIGKLAGNNWNSGTWQKFGPGGFRSFNETLGPEVCQRAGLFRHPTDCTKFYECYWDKWIEKFTLHIFPCPVAMAVREYDESISACNWPFLGPNCEGNTIINK